MRILTQLVWVRRKSLHKTKLPGLPSGWSKDHTLGKQGLEFRAEILTKMWAQNISVTWEHEEEVCSKCTPEPHPILTELDSLREWDSQTYAFNKLPR